MQRMNLSSEMKTVFATLVNSLIYICQRAKKVIIGIFLVFDVLLF